MSNGHWIVGIDLGTTNTVVAAAAEPAEAAADTPVEVWAVPQVVQPAELAPKPLLPSFLYLPGEGELPGGSLALPWDALRTFAVGQFARDRAATVPARVITSAKSWLSHAGVDRTAAILPWGVTAGRKLSPVDASARYLGHIREAWNHANPANPLAEQDVVLTVPASFDAAARELTAQAARQAGLEHIVLLEEPQAAFYAWLYRHASTWPTLIQPGELVLVCDVGGGTSDFSLIRCDVINGVLGFVRTAVGDHILLGGDNMDLALAADVEPTLSAGRKLDVHQWAQLRDACRVAKQTLLGGDPPSAATVTVLGRGSSLIGGALRGTLTGERARELLLNGFFPKVSPHDTPQRGVAAGLAELHLPFASDPAITRHLAAFLCDPASGQMRRPDAVLFNGGVFRSELFRHRVMDVLAGWFPERPPRLLAASDDDLDHAVARGAAYFGLVRRGFGVRIGGGAARSFYLGLDAGSEQTPTGLCVAQQGMQEGERLLLDRQFELLIKKPVAFPLYTSSLRAGDRVGDVVTIDPPSMAQLPTLRTVLKSGGRSDARHVRVQLESVLTEVGTLELYCRSVQDERRWRLAFDVRGGGSADTDDTAPAVAIAKERVTAAEQVITSTFKLNGLPPERVMSALRDVLGESKERWPTVVLRQLFDNALATADARRLTPEHEARWLTLAGYALRPGFGSHADEFRVQQLWKLFQDGPIHRRKPAVMAAWWVTWRRVAGGLNKGQQHHLLAAIQPLLAKPEANTGELAEAWQLAANLERVAAAEKTRLGERVLARLSKHKPDRPTLLPRDLWVLGRLGARVPLYGPADTVVPAADAAAWVRVVLDRHALTQADGLLAVANLARRSNDRARDLDEPLRGHVIAALRNARAKTEFIDMVEHGGDLASDQQAAIYGEALPPALRLAND